MGSYSLYMKKNFLFFEVLFLEFLNGFLTFVIEFVFILRTQICKIETMLHLTIMWNNNMKTNKTL